MKAQFVAFAVLVWIHLGCGASCLHAETFSTRNFSVVAPDLAFAKIVAEKAEVFRADLADLWLGRQLPDWPERCPITVEISRHAGGETSFAFVADQQGISRPIDWQMSIFGSPERLLDSVLPHEVTHTIFATHFGCPLPRWADEGACTTVEHLSEKRKSHQMLIDFLTHQRGIPFNRMFEMKQYPRDILPLYAQGHSVTRYLIEQRGHRHFVNFVGAGMGRERPGKIAETWNAVCKEYYGYHDLSDLQIRWLVWVEKGSPKLARLASNLAVPGPIRNEASATVAIVSPLPGKTGPVAGESWYVRQSLYGGNSQIDRPDPALWGAAHERPYAPGSIPSGPVIRDSTTSGRETIWR